LKLSVRLAGTDLDFETSDLLDILVDPDDTGPEPFQTLAHFTAPSGNDKFITDGTTRLGIGFQDVTYDLPAGATQLVVRFECLTTWWNEIVALDFVRITAGAVSVDPFISVERSGTDILINYSGTLQVADEVTGPFTDVATGVDQQLTLQPDPQVPHRFYRAAGN
jgi:hypothetical protein